MVENTNLNTNEIIKKKMEGKNVDAEKTAKFKEHLIAHRSGVSMKKEKKEGGKQDPWVSKHSGDKQGQEKAKSEDYQATLFIRNIGWNTNQEDFKTYMQKFGEVKYAVLCRA
jgi:RNA recognition motif-containing protein